MAINVLLSIYYLRTYGGEGGGSNLVYISIAYYMQKGVEGSPGTM